MRRPALLLLGLVLCLGLTLGCSSSREDDARVETEPLAQRCFSVAADRDDGRGDRFLVSDVEGHYRLEASGDPFFFQPVDGAVEAGPNAVLALRREGYGRFSFSLRDTLETLGYGGFWCLAGRFWQTGLQEYRRSFSKGMFVRDLQRLVPELRRGDLLGGGAGVRAQAVDPAGKLLDDFHIVEGEGMIHVLNAPSPAATASISIGRTVAARARQALEKQAFSA
jgi:L-2-hydroxyglutarate oxidase LhgO